MKNCKIDMMQILRDQQKPTWTRFHPIHSITHGALPLPFPLLRVEARGCPLEAPAVKRAPTKHPNKGKEGGKEGRERRLSESELNIHSFSPELARMSAEIHRSKTWGALKFHPRIRAPVFFRGYPFQQGKPKTKPTRFMWIVRTVPVF